jgi:hypothetical protein
MAQNLTALSGGTGQNAAGVETKLLDYIAKLQAEGMSRQQFANPAALGNEAFKVLRGYLQHVRDFQVNGDIKGGGMSNADLSTPREGKADAEAALAPGPAKQSLETASAAGGAPAGEMNGVSGPELNRAIELLSGMLNLSLEMTFVGTATSNVTKSANTLIRGQ